MNLKSVREILPGTRVILRMDLDVADGDNSRLEKSIPTINFLLKNNCKIAIIGHKGRPNGVDEKLSLKSVYVELMSLLEPDGNNVIESVFVSDPGDKVKMELAVGENQVIFLENLRFWPEEESGDSTKLRNCLIDFEVYVNDALAVSHRKAASILLFKEMPGYYGLAFIEEVEKILKVIENPKRPLTVILGGAKEDKLNYLEELEKIADNVLIGGKLPLLVESQKSESLKVMVAKLREDKLDLSDEDIENFKKIIAESGMIVWAGAMGWFEKTDCQKGTLEIAKAVAESPAYKIIAGGDTGASIKNLGLSDKIDLVASGGGVMLELLAKGGLPAWE